MIDYSSQEDVCNAMGHLRHSGLQFFLHNMQTAFGKQVEWLIPSDLDVFFNLNIVTKTIRNCYHNLDKYLPGLVANIEYLFTEFDKEVVP